MQAGTDRRRVGRWAMAKAAAWGVGFACASLASGQGGGLPLTTIIKAGDPLPGVTGITLNAITEASIGSGGHIVMRVGPGNASAVIRTGVGGGQPVTIARFGVTAPGLSGGEQFSSFDGAIVDAAGRVLIKAQLQAGPGGTPVVTNNNLGLWLFDPAGAGGAGSLTKVVREGDAVPGIANAAFDSLADEAFNNGRVVFRTTMVGSGIPTNTGISVWTMSVLGGGETPTLIARQGSPSPVPGENWRSFVRSLIDSSGSIAFEAATSVGAGGTANSHAFRRSSAGVLTRVLGAGQAAPGLQAGRTIASISVDSINAFGETVMSAFINGGAGPDRVLYLHSGSTFTVLGRSTVAIAGTSPALMPTDFAFIGAGGLGNVHFSSGLAGTGITTSNDRANLLRTGTTVSSIIAREGAPAPGIAGATFGFSDPTVYSMKTLINGDGELLLTAPILGGSGSSPRAVWFFDPTRAANDRFVLITQSGTEFEFSPGNVVSVGFIDFDGFGGVNEGKSRALNDRGEALIRLTLSNGRVAIVLATLGTTPTTGACCNGSICQITTQAACAGSNTRFAGAGTICNVGGNLTTPCCRADFNQSGGAPTVQDIFDYLNAYFTAAATADFSGSGGITIQDIFDYLGAYFAGC